MQTRKTFKQGESIRKDIKEIMYMANTVDNKESTLVVAQSERTRKINPAGKKDQD